MIHLFRWLLLHTTYIFYTSIFQILSLIVGRQNKHLKLKIFKRSSEFLMTIYDSFNTYGLTKVVCGCLKLYVYICIRIKHLLLHLINYIEEKTSGKGSLFQHVLNGCVIE